MGTRVFGVYFPDANEQNKGGPFKVTVTLDNPQEVKEMENFDKNFKRYYVKLFSDLVAETHKYLIRLTPMHTGRLRGGWTAYLDKYQRDYARQLKDTSLYDSFKKQNKTAEHQVYKFDQAEFEKGKSESQLEDKLPNDTDVNLDNKVPYLDAMDYGTTEVPARHFTEQAKYKGELWFQMHFNMWLAEIERAGAIIPPPKVREIDV